MVATPVVRIIDGKRVVEWPDPRPASFEISSDLFEQMVAELNDLDAQR